MARNLFGGSSDDYVVDSSGRPIASRRMRFYTSTARTTEITDLASDAAGTGAPLTVSSDAHGYLGSVYGPDGVTVMYAGAQDANGNPPTYVVALYTHSSTAAGVASFNGRSGPVSLSKADVTGTGLAAADVSADVSGAAATVQTNLTAEVTRAQAAEAALGGGMQFRTAVVVATTNQALTGLPTVDAVTLTAGQVILLTGQTAGSQNGLWAVASGAWTRPSNFAAGSDATATSVLVESGTSGAGATYAVTGTTSNVVGTNVLTFVKTSGTAASVTPLVPGWSVTTAYTAGQHVVAPYGSHVTAKANHTSGSSFTAANWNFIGTIDVRDFGVKWDNGTDDTAALQAAVNAASFPVAGKATNDVPAVIVQLPPGYGWIRGTISIPANVDLRGQGMQATWVYRPGGTGITTPVFALASGAVCVAIRDLGITNNDTIAACIDYTGGDGPSALADQACLVENVIAVGGLHGVHDGGTENRYLNVHCYRQWQHGFWLQSTDSFMTNCTAAASGQANSSVFTLNAYGFNLNGADHTLVGCKTFGVLRSAGAGDAAGGFQLAGSGRMRLTACSAQDCDGSGFIFSAGDCVLTSCEADSCNWSGFNLGGALNSVLAGCCAYNRGGVFTMVQAVVGGAAGCVIKGLTTTNVRRFHTTGGGDSSAIAMADVDGRFGMQAVAYAATITPDPWLGGDVYVGSLTGALTIANPQSNPTNGADGTSAWYQIGQELTFVLPQDATGGRAVTFGTAYKTTGAITTTASSVTTITFKFDGTNWREKTRAVT